MKILFIYFKYPFFIEGSYFQEFLNKLAEKVKSVYLLATWYPKKQFKKSPNIEFFWLPLLRIRVIEELLFILFAFIKVVFTKKLHEVDLVNSIGPRGILAGWYLKKIYNIPFVCTIEIINEKNSFFNCVYYELVKFMIKHSQADRIICWSNYYWENHLKLWGVPVEKVVIISAGINTNVFSPRVNGGVIKKKYGQGKPLIVFAKPLYPANAESAKLLVHSVALLQPEMIVKLLIGGGPCESEVRKLVFDLGVSRQVSFMPPTPFPEIPKYIAAADLVVLPFIYAATTSRSLLEAMAMKKPIITVATGEVGRIMIHKENCILIKPNPLEISSAIKDVLTNRVLARHIAKNACKLVRSNFSIEKIISQNIMVFRKVVRYE